ncbi:saccharopine dehydrogenase family protein [Leptolyngbya sp. AN02str]|uniref:saccharopine dehydrogenase family protein n=1 Tax=Leptolyngbya sp. AN02str TaxID=3423363 RepID=UPI003D3170AA
MTQRILILGGRGRIGASVAQDLLHYTDATVVITSRQPVASWVLYSERVTPLQLDIADQAALKTAIASSDLVIHCAGPFFYQEPVVLETCIQLGVTYVDVSDTVPFVRRAQALHEVAVERQVTAVLSTGVFPGISNSLAKLCLESLDDRDELHLSYIVGGSGGAGIGVLRTTFLGLMHPFKALINGEWVTVKPYSDREAIDFPPPFHRGYVYWYEVPETVSLAELFPIKTVITKFGSVPDLYNRLTWITAHVFPKAWLHNPNFREAMAHISYRMTRVSDRFGGIDIAIRVQVTGTKDGKPCKVLSTIVHPNTAIAAGLGTGSVAQLILSGHLQKPGVWSVEHVLPTEQFLQTMDSREISINLTVQ